MEYRVCFAMAMYENDMFFVMIDIQCIYWCFFVIPKSIFIRQDRLNKLKLLKVLHVLLGLSPVWNCYPKGGHKKGTT